MRRNNYSILFIILKLSLVSFNRLIKIQTLRRRLIYDSLWTIYSKLKNVYLRKLRFLKTAVVGLHLYLKVNLNYIIPPDTLLYTGTA